VKRIESTLLGILLVSGCADALPEITDVEGPRTLAVTVRVVGDGERSSPRPGETVRVSLVVADEGPRRSRDFEFVVCVPTESDLDVGVCRSTIASGHVVGSAGPLSAEHSPTFDLVVPDATSLDGATELLVHGAVCADGALASDLALERFPDTFETDSPCADPARVGEYVVFRIPLEGTAPNVAPGFADLVFDEEPWTGDASIDAPSDGCVDSGLPVVPADETEHTIAIRLAAGSREPYASDEGTQSTERPIVAFHANEGDFEGAYTFFSDDEPRYVVYRARDDRDPSAIPDDGRLARFTFVVRDGRGGTSATTRALCLVP